MMHGAYVKRDSVFHFFFVTAVSYIFVIKNKFTDVHVACKLRHSQVFYTLNS